MATREEYFVCRAYVKWKGHMYLKGDVFPPTFTHHDKARSIYNSRIGMRIVDEQPQEPIKVEEKSKPVESAEKPLETHPLSGSHAAVGTSAKTTATPKKGISGATNTGTSKK